MGITTLEFTYRLPRAPGPPADAKEADQAARRLIVRHTGAVRRRGIEVKPRGRAADALLADAAFTAWAPPRLRCAFHPHGPTSR